jgi:hypothetical protein
MTFSYTWIEMLKVEEKVARFQTEYVLFNLDAEAMSGCRGFGRFPHGGIIKPIFQKCNLHV